jgi:hypothetical protein
MQIGHRMICNQCWSRGGQLSMPVAPREQGVHVAIAATVFTLVVLVLCTLGGARSERAAAPGFAPTFEGPKPHALQATPHTPRDLLAYYSNDWPPHVIEQERRARANAAHKVSASNAGADSKRTRVTAQRTQRRRQGSASSTHLPAGGTPLRGKR